MFLSDQDPKHCLLVSKIVVTFNCMNIFLTVVINQHWQAKQWTELNTRNAIIFCHATYQYWSAMLTVFIFNPIKTSFKKIPSLGRQIHFSVFHLFIRGAQLRTCDVLEPFKGISKGLKVVWVYFTQLKCASVNLPGLKHRILGFAGQT